MRVAAAILAAGRGERLRISTPKPLVPLLGRPMISYAVEALRKAGVASPIVITSPSMRPELQRKLGRNIRYVIQPHPLGTGDAVSRLKPMLRGPAKLIVINADSPLFEPAHIHSLLEAHSRKRARVSFATAVVEDPGGLGRVLRDPSGQVANIIEEAEASDEVLGIREINAGLYVFDVPAIFKMLAAVKPVGPKRERHLTRAVELAIARGFTVATVAVPAEASLGVNTLAEAAAAQAYLLSRKLAGLMNSGVIIDDPANVYIDWTVNVGSDSRIMPGTILSGSTTAGRNCILGPNSLISGAWLGNRVKVGASWVIESRIEDGAEIGPFAHVRPGSVVKPGARVGTHAEIVRTTLGKGTNMNHFSYLGDATVGPRANIGAGAVTANYDGSRKWPSRIGAKAFIGSGSILVAPAAVGQGAVLGAGAVLPKRRKVPARAIFAGVPARPLRKRHGK